MQTVKEKTLITEDLKNLFKKWDKPFFMFILSFLICNFKIGFSFHPLTLSYLSAVGKESFPFALLGTVLGTFFFVSGRSSLRYICSVLLFFGAKTLFSNIFSHEKPLNNALLSSFCLLLPSLFTVFQEFSLPSLLLYGGEALSSFAASLILRRFIKTINEKLPLSRSNSLCLGLGFSFFYMAALPLKIADISLAECMGFALLFFASFNLKPSCPLISGPLLGLLGFFSGSTSAFFFFSSLSLSLYIFSFLGKLPALFISLFFSCLTSAVYNVSSSLIFLSLETLLGFSLSFLIPQSLKDRFPLALEEKDREMFKNSSAYILNKSSDALKEIGEITEKVSKEVEKLKGEPMESYVERCISKTCKKCRNSPSCWQRHYSRSYEEVRKLFIDGKNSVPLDLNSFTKKTGCERADKMEQAVLNESGKYKEFLSSRDYASNIRFIMCDQFSGMSSLLSSLQKNVSSLIPFEDKEEAEISEILKEAGAVKEGSFGGRNKDGIIFLSFLFEPLSLKKQNMQEITASLSETLKTPLDAPSAEEEKGLTRLLWRSVPALKARFDYYQTASGRKKLCGDSVSTSSDLLGNPLFFLSDGMGVGGDAAVDSTMTTSLLSRLMASGASFPASLRLVSSSLLSLKEERLCTVDFFYPDLFKGSMSFYKAGAAPSYILRFKKCYKVSKSALPAGILGGAEAAKSVFTLKENDLVLLVSDGVTETGEDWITTSLPLLSDKDPLFICKEILKEAEGRSISSRCDDMTAICVKFLQG